MEITEFFSKLTASGKVPTFQNEVSIKKVTSWTVLAAGFSVSYSAPPGLPSCGPENLADPRARKV